MAQVEQVLEQIEAGTRYPKEGKVNSWLNDVQSVDQKKADQLKSRWFAALEKSVKPVIQLVNTPKENTLKRSRMDSRLEAIGIS